MTGAEPEPLVTMRFRILTFVYFPSLSGLQATGLHFRHTDNVIQWLNAMAEKGLPKVMPHTHTHTLPLELNLASHHQQTFIVLQVFAPNRPKPYSEETLWSNVLFFPCFFPSDLLPGNHGHIRQKEHAALHLLYPRAQVRSLFHD